MKRMVKAHARGLIGARNRRDFATSDDDPTTDDRGERMTAEDDLLVAAKYAELETRALASVVSSRETAGEAKLNTGVPEFTFDDDDDDDGDGDGDESSEWSDSDDDPDEALDDDDDDASTSCESIDAKDLPEWLRRARDGPPRTAEEKDDAAHDGPPRTRNEIAAEARAVAPVPTIEANEEIRAVGRVTSVVGRVVVVSSATGTVGRASGAMTSLDDAAETLDEESVLCLRDRRGLGVIEEVFGPVSAPLYSVRLPAKESEDGEDAAPKVAVNDEVYVVVGRSRTIPNVRSLYKKGYDASGKDDEEVANDEEFSDDEAEAAAKAAKKKPGKKRTTSGRNRERRPIPPSPMGGGGMFGMRGLPRPQPPAHYAQAGATPAGAPPAYGAPGQGQPMMYVPVQYNAQGQPVIMMPPPARGAPLPPPPPPPPPPPNA